MQEDYGNYSSKVDQTPFGEFIAETAKEADGVMLVVKMMVMEADEVGVLAADEVGVLAADEVGVLAVKEVVANMTEDWSQQVTLCCFAKSSDSHKRRVIYISITIIQENEKIKRERAQETSLDAGMHMSVCMYH